LILVNIEQPSWGANDVWLARRIAWGEVFSAISEAQTVYSRDVEASQRAVSVTLNTFLSTRSQAFDPAGKSP
jgi:hypothetical protein